VGSESSARVVTLALDSDPIAAIAAIAALLRMEIRESYGMDGILSRLPGENLNYLVTAQDGRRAIAKIAGTDMPEDVVEMEFFALEHAGKAQLGLDLPQVIKNLHGKIETRINFHNNEDNRLRLLHYVAGFNLSEISDISKHLRFDLGKSLARFDQALAGFEHPAAHRQHRWNLADAAHLPRLPDDGCGRSNENRRAGHQWLRIRTPIFCRGASCFITPRVHTAGGIPLRRCTAPHHRCEQCQLVCHRGAGLAFAGVAQDQRCLLTRILFPHYLPFCRERKSVRVRNSHSVYFSPFQPWTTR
jgi:hypothetical protein